MANELARLVDNGRGGYDDVRGIVIGGDWVTWRLFYDGRPQGGHDTADTESAAIDAATKRCRELKDEWQEFGLYPDDSKWEVRLG